MKRTTLVVFGLTLLVGSLNHATQTNTTQLAIKPFARASDFNALSKVETQSSSDETSVQQTSIPIIQWFKNNPVISIIGGIGFVVFITGIIVWNKRHVKDFPYQPDPAPLTSVTSSGEMAQQVQQPGIAHAMSSSQSQGPMQVQDDLAMAVQPIEPTLPELVHPEGTHPNLFSPTCQSVGSKVHSAMIKHLDEDSLLVQQLERLAR